MKNFIWQLESGQVGATIFNCLKDRARPKPKKGLTFEPHWEKPTVAVLDYFGLTEVFMVGISWAGYLALRAAAYNILYDGFDCMVSQFPRPLKGLMRFLFHVKAERLMNVIMEIIAKKRFFVDRALSYG